MRFCHRAGIPFLLLIVIWAARQQSAYADQVTLTYGDRISGRIISVTQDALRIQTPAFGTIQIERKYVEQISTDEPRVVDLVSGERVIGQLTAGEGKTVIIRSSILGERRIPLDTINVVQAAAESEDDQNVSGVGTSQLQTERGGGGTPVPLAGIQGKGAGSAAVPGRQAASGAEAQQQTPIGQRPEDVEDIRKIFLRQSTVLLRPGQVEVETAFKYQHTQVVSPIVNTSFRQFQLPMATRIGLFSRAEGFVSIPAAYARREIGFAESVAFDDKAGIGDASAGLNYELARETARWPDIILSVGLETPTGSRPNEQGLSLGAGHWNPTAGFQFIKTIDPVALFGGFNYAHSFEARYFLGDAVHNVEPGGTAGYNFGFGFAVNENVSLSAQVLGSYQSDMKADGKKVSASSREPVLLRSALTYRYSKGTYIEPSIAIGLDYGTPDFVLGISLTHRFRE